MREAQTASSKNGGSRLWQDIVGHINRLLNAAVCTAVSAIEPSNGGHAAAAPREAAAARQHVPAPVQTPSRAPLQQHAAAQPVALRVSPDALHRHQNSTLNSQCKR